jgi:small subunit ribosomal protein S16
VAVKIKLMRMGKMRAPYYRIVVADARTKRDGRAIEEIGKYHPKEDPSYIEVKADRAAYWLGVGAQPTEAVTAILKVSGDWQKFTGEPAPPAMKVAAAKPDKKVAFEAAAKEGLGEPTTEATTPKKRAAKKSAEAPQAEAPQAEATPAAQAEATAAVDETPAASSDQTESAAAEAPAEGAAEPAEPVAEAAEPAAEAAEPAAVADSAETPASAE